MNGFNITRKLPAQWSKTHDVEYRDNLQLPWQLSGQENPNGNGQTSKCKIFLDRDRYKSNLEDNRWNSTEEWNQKTVNVWLLL